ncbi:MAG TPA: DedA family protein [Candidatus Binataceae bacterium]|nr:DedA family protein [Candidatus Binataceae bacterium]
MHEFLKPEHIADWLTTWGYLGIFLFVFIGNLGVPVPEETVLLAAGFLAGREILDLRWVYIITVASAVTGDCCGFILGRTGGQRLLTRLGDRFAFARHRYDRLQTFFHTHGSKAVFMARFIAGVRFMAGPMAGAAGMPFWRFLGWNISGALVWCFIIVTVGYLLGDELFRVADIVHLASKWVALAAVLAGIALLIFWRRERSQAVSPPEP